MTETIGNMLRVGLVTDCVGAPPGSFQAVLGGQSSAHYSPRRVSVHAATAVAILAFLTACSQPPPPVTSAPRTPAVCEALRPALPISYSSSRDTPETVKGVRQANARFSAACP